MMTIKRVMMRMMMTMTMMMMRFVCVLCSCRLMKVGGGLLILMICSINLYFVFSYVIALHTVWLYVMAAFFCFAYLTFVGYLVGCWFNSFLLVMNSCSKMGSRCW